MPTINISQGLTPTERLLAELCERTFLLLWSYPNPFKDDGKELCDLIVVFEDRVFLFFDRESRRFDDSSANIKLNWDRWKRKVIEKQINTSNGAERYIRSGRSIYLDGKKTQELPINIPPNAKISKFVVAHGAKEACKSFSPDNIYGSLAICYDTNTDRSQFSFSPFVVDLPSDQVIHVLDSENLEILLQSLDTITDFSNYITEKEQVIKNLTGLYYCGEEDLLAHYLSNFDVDLKRYRIDAPKDNPDILMIPEGHWSDFIGSDRCKRWKEANECSYVWDQLIQKTCANAINGILGGSNILFGGSSAIHEMAKEPRLSRRTLSERILKSIEEFHIPQDYKRGGGGIMRGSSLMSSFYPDRAYVFLQIYQENKGDYESDYRPMRQAMLEVACGAAKLKMPQLKKVIGIAIDPPKVSDVVSEDFMLMDCEEWTVEDERRYREANDVLRFWETESLKEFGSRTYEFPD